MSEETKKAPAIRFQGFTDDWEQRKLGELMDISSASRVHKNEWTKSGIRFFRSSDVVASFNKKKNTEAFISHELYEKLSSKSGKVCQGDILITGGGSIGIPYLIKDEEPLYFKDADLIWLKNSGKLNGYFLFTYFVTNGFRQYLESISHIGTISHYTIEQAKVTPISLPNKNEQDKIGVFFDKLDNTIALHQRKVTLLKRLKEAYLTRMLPQNSENIPLLRFADYFDPWEQRKFEDLAESFNYGLNASAMEFDGENKYIRITDIDEYSHRFIQSGLTSPNTDLSNANDYLLKEGDILFARTGASVGKSYQYDPLDGKVYYAGFLIRARIKPEFDSSFIFQNTLTEKYNNFIKITSQRSGQPGVNAQEYANFSIMVPSRGEQVKLGNFFKQLDNAIDLHQYKIEKLTDAKKVLLAVMLV